MAFSPALTHAAAMPSQNGSSVMPMLAAFYAGSVLAVTFYCGIFLYTASLDCRLVWAKTFGAMHGMIMTAWAPRAIAGSLGAAGGDRYFPAGVMLLLLFKNLL